MKAVPLRIACGAIIETQRWTILNLRGFELLAAGTMLTNAYRSLVVATRFSSEDTPVDIDPFLDEAQNDALGQFARKPSLVRACERARSALTNVIPERIHDAAHPMVPRKVALECIDHAGIWALLNLEGDERDLAYFALGRARRNITAFGWRKFFNRQVKVEYEIEEATREVRLVEERIPSAPDIPGGHRWSSRVHKVCRQVEDAVMRNYRDYRDRRMRMEKR